MRRKKSRNLYREAEYREIAREIVKKDRNDRKSGLTVDTAGAISRALERAYQQGFTDYRREQTSLQNAGCSKENDTIDWVLIQPRPRAAFWKVCLRLLGEDGRDERAGYLAPSVTKRNTAGWQLIVPDWKEDDQVIGNNSINPLRRLHLLIENGDGSGHLLISELGKRTWREFCRHGGRFPDDLTKEP